MEPAATQPQDLAATTLFVRTVITQAFERFVPIIAARVTAALGGAFGARVGASTEASDCIDGPTEEICEDGAEIESDRKRKDAPESSRVNEAEDKRRKEEERTVPTVGVDEEFSEPYPLCPRCESRHYETFPCKRCYNCRGVWA